MNAIRRLIRLWRLRKYTETSIRAWKKKTGCFGDPKGNVCTGHGPYYFCPSCRAYVRATKPANKGGGK